MAGAAKALAANRNGSLAVAEYPRPVDLVHLARYSLGNKDLEREVLGLFARQADIYVARLMAADGAPAWTEAAHTLKGSARSIGAWDVADAAERAERRAHSDAATRLKSARAVADAVGETNLFIKELLAGT